MILFEDHCFALWLSSEVYTVVVELIELGCGLSNDV